MNLKAIILTLLKYDIMFKILHILIYNVLILCQRYITFLVHMNEFSSRLYFYNT